jgi:GDSL-like Lipase/Acylhydrolase family
VALVTVAVPLAVAAMVFATTAGAGSSNGVSSNGAVSTAGTATTPTTTPIVPGSYVALGDSYTSGPAIPSQLGPGTTPTAPSACLRSSENYPSIVARALGLQVDDVSCGGATTDDLVQSQGPGIPAQLDALRRSTALVSVGIGGNDLGFSTIATNCVAYTPWGPTRMGWSCEAHYGAAGVDPLAAGALEVGGKVTRVLEQIRQRAPGARIFVVGYPDIVPPSGSGCWPSLPYTAADIAFLRGVESELNSALAGAAAVAGDLFVDMATPSASHTVCTSDDTRWVEPIVPSPGAYPLHPGATGMAGMAGVLERAMGPVGP